ncbi:MAG TPA: hypothetical protein VKO38_04610 [Wenzhouxiangella sp.]|nr:hypothetical protein [Wenzhouxiangella sp.]
MNAPNRMVRCGKAALSVPARIQESPLDFEARHMRAFKHKTLPRFIAAGDEKTLAGADQHGHVSLC